MKTAQFKKEVSKFEGIKRTAEMIIDSKLVDTAEQVTIVYTDIVSSTDLIDKVGDGSARDLFNEHDQFVRILEVNELKSRTLVIP